MTREAREVEVTAGDIGLQEGQGAQVRQLLWGLGFRKTSTG